MEIIVTYDPRWSYLPAGQISYWESLGTVDYVTGLLRETGNAVLLVPADDAFESRLRELADKYPGSLVFWLNEFLLPAPGRKLASGRPFTVSVIEKLGLMHTGPGSQALRMGLDKEATKGVFRRLQLPTPESYVVYPGNHSPIDQHGYWNGYVIIKPLQHGDSIGIDDLSVVSAADTAAVRARVERLQHEFEEPVLVERYIGGEGARELTAPMLIAYDGRAAALPVTEIDLSWIPLAQGKFRFLTHDIKQEEYHLKIPAELSLEIVSTIHADAARIIRAMGCRDMARIDMRYDSTGLYYLEVNVDPGKDRFTSYLPAAAFSIGLEYAAIIAFIPYQAMRRYGLDPPGRMTELVRPVMALFDTAQPAAVNP